MTEIRRRPAARPTRDEIALALGGDAGVTAVETTAAYQAALAVLELEMLERFARFRRLGTSGRVASADRFDDMRQLLDLLGVDTIPTSAIPDTDDWPGVILVGCQRLSSDGPYRWLERMLARGAVVVSSDQTVMVPVIAGRLRQSRRRPARRARLTRAVGLAPMRDDRRGWYPLPAGYYPAVRLDPGHVPLTRQSRGVTVLAGDIVTGLPQVVLAAAGGGQVLHSVAHWWQESEPDTTAIGRRRLSDIPAFSTIGREFAEARFGGFCAALVLLSCLVSGIDLALDRAGIIQPQ